MDQSTESPAETDERFARANGSTKTSGISGKVKVVMSSSLSVLSWVNVPLPYGSMMTASVYCPVGKPAISVLVMLVVQAFWLYPVPDMVASNTCKARTRDAPSRNCKTIGTVVVPSPASRAIVPETVHGPIKEP